MSAEAPPARGSSAAAPREDSGPLRDDSETHNPWDNVRLHVVTGKGGTGKTTVAAALALALASHGRRVLLAEVEGRQGICQVLDTPPLPSSETPLLRHQSGGEIHGLAVDAKAALVEYLDIFYHLGRAGRALERVGAIDFATTIAPGVRDILLIGKVYEACRRRGPKPLPDGTPDWYYDAVVLDAPPSGRVGRFLAVNREVADLARVGPFRNQADAITALLRSGSSAVHIVTLLEEMPVQEASDAVAELRADDLPVGAIIVNQARDPLLEPDQLQVLAEGAVDRSAVAASLRRAGLPDDDALVAGLLAQGADHALRMELEEEQFAIVTSLGRPVYALPPLREGVDASGVRVLAQELNDQAEW